MKKSLVLALVVSFVLSLAGTAFAFPVDFSGDFKYEYRNNHDFGGNAYNENRFYTDLKFNGKIDDNTTFFSRFGGEVRDNQSNGSQSKTSGFTMDQFGVKTTAGNWTLALGRQGAQLGQGGVFYSGSDIDPLTYFDGLVATTKMGSLDVKLLGGKAVTSNGYVQTTNLSAVSGVGYKDQDWVGIDVKAPVGAVTVGAAWANKTTSRDPWLGVPMTDARYWGLNFATKIADVVDFSGEYVKSDAATDSSAYTFAGTYNWTNDSLTVAYNNVKGYGVDPVNSNIGTLYYPNGNAFSFPGTAFGYKGFTYAYHHQFTKAMGATAYFLSLEPISGTTVGHKNDELGINVKWSF